MSSSALERLSSLRNLEGVWKEYRPRARNSAAGIDGITPRQFEDHLQANLKLIRTKLLDGYSYSNLRCVTVPKKDPTKFRIICIPTIQDRIVQRAILQVIEKRANQLGINNDVSFGFVKGVAGAKRGTVAARLAAIQHRQMRPWAFKPSFPLQFTPSHWKDSTPPLKPDSNVAM